MLISVIVPVYKVEPYLKRCVDSILNQTFSDFELILVDDGSPDNCGRICDEYAKKDERIRVIHKENGGLSDARNVGIDWCFANSDSEWIAFIDSDDWIHPRYLEALYSAAQKYNSSISVCSYTKSEDFSPYENISDFNMSYLDTEKLFLEYNLEATVAWAKLYKKEYFANVRYPFGKIHEDEYVTYRLLFQNEKVAFVNESLYFYFVNMDSITNEKWSPKKLDVIDALRQQYRFFKKLKNKKLFTIAVKRYIGVLKTQYDKLMEYEVFDEKEKYIKLIRKELGICLRQRCVNIPLKNNNCLYKIAYPKLMILYVFFKRVRKKILRVMGNKEI